MSTILKALRRLEEEKAASEEPRPLREQIATPPRGPLRARRSGWLAAIVALVAGVATGGGVIWWMFGDAVPTRTEVAAVTPAPVTPVAPPPPAPAPPEPAQAVMPGPPDHAFASDVEIVDRPDALPRLADADPIDPTRAEPKPGSHRPVEFSSAAERARQAALAEYNAAERARRGLPPEVAAPAPPAPAEPVPVAAEPVPPAPAQPVPAFAPPPRIPVPAAEPAPQVAAQPAAKPKAPTPAAKPTAPKAKPAPAPPPVAVAVEKTQWHPLADRRIAWLRVPGESDPQRVVEGDVVDGLVVSAIEPSGVVFERNGEKIRRALGK